MKNFGGRLLRGAGRLGLWSLIPLFVAISIWTTVLPALVSPATLPEPTPQDKAAIEQAVKSQGGEKLTKTGYKATIKLSDPEVIKFLDQEEKKAGQSNPGPYVVFSLGNEKVAKAEDNVPADAVVDVANGAIVALSQEFTNERGTICYNVKTIDIVAGNWVIINQYLRGKSMPLLVPVTSKDVSGLTPGFPDTPCFVYPTS